MHKYRYRYRLDIHGRGGYTEKEDILRSGIYLQYIQHIQGILKHINTAGRGGYTEEWGIHYRIYINT